MELLLTHYEQFDAVINYEALVIEANQQLIAQGKVPLHVFYPADGLTIADSPLAYINHGDAAKEQAFLKVQAANHLTTRPNNRSSQSGRRVGRVGMQLDTADRRVFNPDWGIDVRARPVTHYVAQR